MVMVIRMVKLMGSVSRMVKKMVKLMGSVSRMVKKMVMTRYSERYLVIQKLKEKHSGFYSAKLMVIPRPMVRCWEKRFGLPMVKRIHSVKPMVKQRD